MKIPSYTISLGTICVCLILSILIGAAGGYYMGDSSVVIPADKRLNSNKYTFINPLLDDEDIASAPLLNREIDDIKASLENLTEEATDRHRILTGAVYYRDLNNGPWFSLGDENTFKPASLFKLPLMIAFYKKAESNPEILSQVITYEKPFDHVAQQTIDGNEVVIELGKSYTIQELIEHMIIYSDNLAAYLLLENIEPALVTQVFSDFSVPVEANPEDFGPRTYASFLRILYNATYLNKDYSEKALALLSRSTFSHGMRAVIPPGTKASIKYGVANNALTNVKQLHECGIIYWHMDRPHVLCIMTTGTDYEAMAAYTRDVTSTVQSTLLK